MRSDAPVHCQVCGRVIPADEPYFPGTRGNTYVECQDCHRKAKAHSARPIPDKAERGTQRRVLHKPDPLDD